MKEQIEYLDNLERTFLTESYETGVREGTTREFQGEVDKVKKFLSGPFSTLLEKSQEPQYYKGIRPAQYRLILKRRKEIIKNAGPLYETYKDTVEKGENVQAEQAKLLLAIRNLYSPYEDKIKELIQEDVKALRKDLNSIKTQFSKGVPGKKELVEKSIDALLLKLESFEERPGFEKINSLERLWAEKEGVERDVLVLESPKSHQKTFSKLLEICHTEWGLVLSTTEFAPFLLDPEVLPSFDDLISVSYSERYILNDPHVWNCLDKAGLLNLFNEETLRAFVERVVEKTPKKFDEMDKAGLVNLLTRVATYSLA